MKVNTISLPNYSLGEELISSISHGVGAGLAIAGCVLCIVKAARSGNPWAIVASAIYGGTMILLYAMSTLYHAMGRNNAKRVLRVIDHCSVFVLIAGTYTPYTLVAFDGARRWVVFGIIWGLTALGCTFNGINVDKYQFVSVIINLLMGWMIVISYKPLAAAIGSFGVRYLIIGGIVYSIGAALYGIGSKVPYMHSLFHFFVLGGTICHFFSIYVAVL